jgi:hypothetical protein
LSADMGRCFADSGKHLVSSPISPIHGSTNSMKVNQPQLKNLNPCRPVCSSTRRTNYGQSDEVDNILRNHAQG